jgi:hypothetical protein
VALLTQIVDQLFSDEAAASNDYDFHFLIHLFLLSFSVESPPFAAGDDLLLLSKVSERVHFREVSFSVRTRQSGTLRLCRRFCAAERRTVNG